MFRLLPYLLPLAAWCCPVWADAPAADTHQSLAKELVDLLSETEICLNSCQDAASVEAAIPTLQQLAAKTDDLVARRAALPAPTIQDDMAAADLVDDFATIWQAICKHIERLEKAGLVSDALRDVLKLAPPTDGEHPVSDKS